MERVMILDDEDIIKLIAKSVDVDISSVRLSVRADATLYKDDDDDDTEEGDNLSWIDASLKIFAKIELPVTQIDGTEVDVIDSDIDCNEGDDDDNT